MQSGEALSLQVRSGAPQAQCTEGWRGVMFKVTPGPYSRRGRHKLRTDPLGSEDAMGGACLHIINRDTRLSLLKSAKRLL